MSESQVALRLGFGLALLCGLACSAGAEERFFEVRAKRFAFTPHVLTVNRGDTVRIRLLSEDVHHGMYLDGYGLQTSAYPGHDGGLRFVADKPGRFSFRCSVTCGEFHPYMIGHLRVEPNTPFHLLVLAVLAVGLIGWGVATLRRQQEEPSHDR
jgi:cytochrome c oxidase subunit 2